MNALIRTQISLSPDQKQQAGKIASWQNVSLSELIRQALSSYLKTQEQKRSERKALAERLAGAWKNSPNWKNVDAVKYQRQIRREKGI